MTETPQQPPIDRRLNLRYKLVKPLMGVVEHRFLRHAGRVLDLSLHGFLLFVPDAAPGSFLGSGSDDFGEISHGERTFGGFGAIVNERPLPGGVGIGFRWDDYVREGELDLVQELIGELVAHRAAGSVTWKGPLLLVAGHLSAALATDIYTAHQAGASKIALSSCTSIDSSGLDLLMHLKGIGCRIENASEEIRGVLARFHLLD